MAPRNPTLTRLEEKPMMRIFAAIALLLSVFVGRGLAAVETMEAVGRGETRYLGMIKVFDATLYVDPAARHLPVLHPGASRCLKLTYAVDVEANDFVAAADTVLSRQHDEKTLAAVADGIRTLHGSYRDVEAGDSYTLCYNARDEKTRLAKNGAELAAIPSAEFAAINFGIWLGEKESIDERLQRRLVGTAQRATVAAADREVVR
jgi:hypothetical protein